MPRVNGQQYFNSLGINENQSKGTLNIANRIPHCMDTKISQEFRESWPERVSKQSFSEDIEGDARIESLEMGRQEDPIQATMIIGPEYSVSEGIGRIKGQGACLLRKNFVWSPGYFISSVGLKAKSIMGCAQWKKR